MPRLVVTVVWNSAWMVVLVQLSRGSEHALWNVLAWRASLGERWLLCCCVFVNVLHMYSTLESSSQEVLRLVRAFVRKQRGPSSAVYTRLAKCSGNNKGICISSWNRALSRAQTCPASIGHSEPLTQEPGFQADTFPLHFSPCFHSTRKDEGKTLSPVISTSSSRSLVGSWKCPLTVPPAALSRL